jgi:hypothetical protein
MNNNNNHHHQMDGIDIEKLVKGLKDTDEDHNRFRLADHTEDTRLYARRCFNNAFVSIETCGTLPNRPTYFVWRIEFNDSRFFRTIYTCNPNILDVYTLIEQLQSHTDVYVDGVIVLKKVTYDSIYYVEEVETFTAYHRQHVVL